MDETISQALEPIEPWSVLSGPENAIWDDIFDWILNAIKSIGGVVWDAIKWVWSAVTNLVTTWISWLWKNVKSFFDWLWSNIKSWFSWLGDKFSWLWGEISRFFINSWSSLTKTIGSWFSQVWSWFRSIWDWISDKSREIGQAISSAAGAIYDQVASLLSSSMSWVVSAVSDMFIDIKRFFTEIFPEWLLLPAKFIGQLLDGVADWFMEDIPGHSPRWLDVITAPFQFIAKWLFEFPKWFFQDFPERVAYGLQESFKWVSDTIEPIIGTFMDALNSFVSSLGYMSPETAGDNFQSIAKMGFTVISGLIGMTVAGELLHPLKEIGLGNISAMVWDMTNYKLITGAFVGALTWAAVQQPLRYHFANMFRPMLLAERDFTQLLSRGAFDAPELLRNEALSSAVAKVGGGAGGGYVSTMVGYYGYRPEYEGFFRELSYSPIGYFGLAGIARGGFFDELWFLEALARTGYSPSARAALMGMFRRQYYDTLEKPVQGILGKLVREGFVSTEGAREVIARVDEMTDINDVKALSLELQTVYEEKSQLLDISLRAFSRGIIPESEARSNLADILIRGSTVDIHITREKLGLIRRLSWTPPEAGTVFQYVED